MPRYIPIQTGVPIRSSESDLLTFQWRTNGIAADFIVPDYANFALRVSFDQACIVRLLDEMPLSTEDDDTPNEGLIAENFAYRVEGARFARIQSEAWMFGLEPVEHYRFITGWGCLDVLSRAAPAFLLVRRASERSDVKGSDPITVDDAFEAMRVFLEAYWNRGDAKSDDIAVLLGSLNRNREAGIGPLDPAQWEDWLDAVSSIAPRNPTR
ncbi:hypothetical protein [Methylobacterium sp. Leaf456]|uniref:hypothetical protein n=1 Tax=Methylobacterium sp. Leaf456 TaxID=1736382 RepID=UPI000A4103B8|nr:hypothetical protein [Methylobacterium sp. Leaf456]